MKSLQESLFDSDLVSKQTDDMIRLDVQNQLQEIAESNPEIGWKVVNNRNGSISNIIMIRHTVHPANASGPECVFSASFEVVFEEDLELYVYLSTLHFFVRGSDKLQRKYNNFVQLDARLKPRLPYIKLIGKNAESLSMRSSRAMSFLCDDLKQIINNFYNKETLKLMQQYVDVYMETDKRPTPIMNKIAGNICKIYSKFNY